MVVALLIGASLLVIVLYAWWMAGELGLGPPWRRRRAPDRPARQDIGDEPDERQVANRR